MKNYPNQASSFAKIRGTLQTISELLARDEDVTDDQILGYEAARRGHYTFRGLGERPTAAEVEARIAEESSKPPGSQGARTFARELRRTLMDMRWLSENSQLTPSGAALLASEPGSVEEQALLIEGLLAIRATHKGGTSAHHPVITMLKLLERAPSMHRVGLELALEPEDDSDEEFSRIAALYDLAAADRLVAHPIGESRRANAVKIFPPLAVYAGLVSEEAGEYFLTQDGLRVLGYSPAEGIIATQIRRGRRTTPGRLVTPDTAGKARSRRPPKMMLPSEQLRAAERLAERDDAHQAAVRRVARQFSGKVGDLLEDDFSYDLLWLPGDAAMPALLFEVKTVTGVSDAYAQARRAHAQLSYYEYFHVRPTLEGRQVQRVAVFDGGLPEVLVEYLTFENVTAVLSDSAGQLAGLNEEGVKLVDMLRG